MEDRGGKKGKSGVKGGDSPPTLGRVKRKRRELGTGGVLRRREGPRWKTEDFRQNTSWMVLPTRKEREEIERRKGGFYLRRGSQERGNI